MKITIDGRNIGPDSPPYIVAELSANHNGSLDRAFECIKQAKVCGADAVKLQTYTADTMTIDCDLQDFLIKGGLWDGYKLYDLYKWAHTPPEWHADLFAYAREIGITLFSTPFDESAVDLLEDLGTPAYKIASFEATDLPLVRYAASTGKPLIISTGMMSEEEINETMQCVRDAGCEDIVLLHCVSSYPTPANQAYLRKIQTLHERFNVLTGLSDHTLGTAVSVAATALGASIIEKHFTLNRQDKGPDSEFSIEPDELRTLCRDTREAWSAMGRAGFERPPVEESSRKFRRSVYFVRDMKAGQIITGQDIRRIRPGYGLAPKYFDGLIGRRVKSSVKRGTPVRWELLDE